jgi:hypothetical protein
MAAVIWISIYNKALKNGQKTVGFYSFLANFSQQFRAA